MENGRFDELYGSCVFNDVVMKQRLPDHIYQSLKHTVNEGTSLEPSIADEVAAAMRDWAVENGATHFTHWFQPLTGITAERHDSFLQPDTDGKAILEFSGKMLIRGETDASSFPSGGLRDTFEARGYTAWDCTSPAFIKDGVLYIPTAFCSYNGDALDKKTPLLRSMEALSRQSLRILRLLGNTTSRKVTATCGPEQEYFLVDRKFYEQRKDLMLCGRTLIGAKPAKGQELDDHYYGRIKLRVNAFMQELDRELWKLGVPSKTRHNEVAPAQHELAPVYATANIACDHNQLIMILMRQIAKRHGLACLLHEKPFAGVNGSGKHNNWSLSTDDGEVLLDPGETPMENTRFLLFLSAVIKAVDDYADLLRFSIAVPGNDLRLGGNEAPPAIVSVFLGDELGSVVDSIVSGNAHVVRDGNALKTGVSSLPPLPKDNTDRNRTSPFAFTGNKFEFRMCGSSASVADSCTVLNAIVADTLRGFAEELEAANGSAAALLTLIKRTLTEHGRIIFNGNNYSDKWVKEAARRGLPNFACAVDVIPVIKDEKNLKMFERGGIFSRTECMARYEIELEKYAKTINIEAQTMAEMVRRQVIPAIMRYAGDLAAAAESIRSVGGETEVYRSDVAQMTAALGEMRAACRSLEEQVERARDLTDPYEKARAFHRNVVPAMETLRGLCDSLEQNTDEAAWPIPSYFDLMFRM